MSNTQLTHNDHLSKQHKYQICFLAHDIEVPMNIGSLFRIADALGVNKIWLSGDSILPPNSKIRKTSRSTEKYVDYDYHKDPFVVIKHLRQVGYKIISLEVTSSSIDIKELQISFDEKVCLILGSEKKGVCQQLLDISDLTVHIPMCGYNSSMNVAVACAIATFEIIGKISKL